MKRALALVVVILVAASQAQAAAPAPRLIVAPGADALVKHNTVRIVVARDAGAKTRVQLNDRDVTARLRVTGGRLVGELRLSNGLRPGRNHLVVVSRAGGRSERRSVRSFFVVRRSTRFARVRLTGRNPATLKVDVVSGAPRAELARRQRILRVWLNGRSVAKAMVARTGTSWTASLSGTHGLRHGVNRLSVLVAEPRDGRYTSVRRRFTVQRDRPLAAAGVDRTMRPSVRLRLGGAHRAARGGRLTYRWTLVDKPAGSRATIGGSTNARPSLVPDRPGRYVARVRVTERPRGRASAAQTTLGTTVDDAVMQAIPKSTLLELAANAFPSDPRGIQLGKPGNGGTFYPHTGPAATIQWLELDRRTLQPAVAGNTWCCDDADHSLDSLTAKLQQSNLNNLVILALPPQRNTLPQSQYKRFNDALGAIGVNPLDDVDDLDKQGQQIVAVGIPTAGLGSGWLMRSHKGNPRLAKQGWLMPDADLSAGYRFQPLQVPFNTNAASTATSNTMTFGGESVTSPPLGTPTGFHFVEVDPADLSVVRNLAFDNDAGGRAQLANAISAASELDNVGDMNGRGNYVALQSIGGFAPDNPGWDDKVSLSLTAIGANPHYFNYRSPSYSFFGGAHLGSKGAAQSNAGLVLDTTTGAKQRGTLSGEARMGPDGFFLPPTGSATNGPVGSLYDVIFNADPAPWPYTSGPDADAYQKALAYISGELTDPHVNPAHAGDFTKVSDTFSTDIRGAYLGLPDYAHWDSVSSVLSGSVHYPGAQAGACRGPPTGGDEPGFTLTQFCNLKQALLTEFADLDATLDYKNKLVQALQVASSGDQARLITTFTTIKEKVDPPESEIASPLLGLMQTLAEFADLAEVALAPEAAAAVSLAGDVVELTSAVSNSADKPLGTALDDTVQQLGGDLNEAVYSGVGGLLAVRAAAMSDRGRLKALADAARAAGAMSQGEITDQLVNASGRYYTSALMEALKGGKYHGFRIFTDGSGRDGGPKPDDCRYRFRGAPDGAWVPILFQLDLWSSLVFGWDGGTSTDYPPDEILRQMFESPNLGAPIPALGRGYGIDKSTWFWQQADNLTTRARQYDKCKFGS
jgi:hypothetical protein